MPMHQDVRLHTTRDGSHSLYSERFQQFYHNPNGALAESLHVFFEQSGLIVSLQKNEPVSILEIGFGTGLNLVLLADLVEKNGTTTSVSFESMEAWPVHPDQSKAFNYGELLGNLSLSDNLQSVFEELQQQALVRTSFGPVLANIHRRFFDDFRPQNQPFTHIFHDPFSPEVNGELWTPAVFKKLLSWSAPDVVLSTYCASSAARAAMSVAGWFVARAPGALGKREMTLASQNPKKLENFIRINETRLRQRWKNGDFNSLSG